MPAWCRRSSNRAACVPFPEPSMPSRTTSLPDTVVFPFPKSDLPHGLLGSEQSDGRVDCLGDGEVIVQPAGVQHVFDRVKCAANDEPAVFAMQPAMQRD